MATYNPKYTVAIITKDQTKYNVTGAVSRLSLQDNDGEIAQRAIIALADIEKDGRRLSQIFNVRDRVYVYANDGQRNEEVFRGFIWERNASGKNHSLSITSYDNLIFFQESEEYQYFSKGYSTKSICSALCEKWGVKLHYNYESITHPKMPLRGNLSDIFKTDLLEEVKKQTGIKPVMLSKQDEVYIDRVGSNSTIYKIYSGKGGNATDIGETTTMQGMITKIVILGKEDENDRAPVADTAVGNTAEYGTLQKVLSVPSGTDLAEVKKEAQEILKEKGTPKQYYSVSAVDIPWIRKGDKVNIDAGTAKGYFIVTSITHNADSKTMDLEVVKA